MTFKYTTQPYKIKYLRKSLEDSINWHKSLTEVCHMFNPDNNSRYRQTILNISKDILNKKNYLKLSTSLYNDDSQYTLFVYHMPFINVNRINIIDNLKIYVNYDNSLNDKISGWSISDNNLYNEEWYNPAEFPLFKSDSQRILYLTICIEMNNDSSLNDIITVITHELQHAIDLIGSLKLLDDTAVDNWLYDEFLKLSDDYIGLYDYMFGYSTTKYLKILSQCAYFTLQTEIHAYIESCISEMKLAHISKEQLLMFCKHYQKYKSDEFEDLIVFSNYHKLLYWINEQLDKVNTNTIKNYSVIAAIESLCKKYKTIKQNQTYIDLLKLYQKRIQYFFKRLAQVVYTNY